MLHVSIRIIVLFALLNHFVLCADWRQGGLKLHNVYRRKHGAPPLSLSTKVNINYDLFSFDSLASYSHVILHIHQINNSAQRCADYLASIKKFGHLCKGRFGHKYGENLGLGHGRDAGSAIISATKSWYSELPKHNFGKNAFQKKSGHFSQVCFEV
jgi:hypothetical protein